MPIPVIDLFAGPGGLGEGFSALLDGAGRPVFRIGLSIEMDPFAHRTLELRAFFRQFPKGAAPPAYYDYLAGDISRDCLFAAHPAQAKHARDEAWHATLGLTDSAEIDARIAAALASRRNWLLIGGPPCQAYSLVGRSKIIGEKGIEEYEADHRHFLYREYLRILAEHRPPVFVMENVKGLLSAKVNNEAIFTKILGDLQHPVAACFDSSAQRRRDTLSYNLFSIVIRGDGEIGEFNPGDFLVRAEEYGVPQARHRLILVGVHSDHRAVPRLLEKRKPVNIEDVIGDLPPLRSGLSKEADSREAWHGALLAIRAAAWLRDSAVAPGLRREILDQLGRVHPGLDRGAEWTPRARRQIGAHSRWYSDDRLRGVANHSTRGHIREDLHRYFFVAAFARVHGRSPLLGDFPPDLLPQHENVAAALRETKFNDRFRVQLAGRPSTTVTSHISKDGHYFIHYDPAQCRSLTVREAARLQTFPDNYFFEGPRTQQYHQVGNAVPPFLAHQIAGIVHDLFP